jgi:hypothetical protein
MSQIHEAILDFNLEKVRETLASTPTASNERSPADLTPLMVLASTTLHETSHWKKLEKLVALELVAQDAAEQVVRNKSLLVIENMAKAIATSKAVDLNAAVATSGKTALHIAAESNNEDLVNVLIDAKADLNLLDAEGRTALFDAKSFSVRRALTYAGADLTIQDKHGNNVLHHILWKHIPDTPSSSMIAKMSPDLLLVKNKEGRTPQEMAEDTVKRVNERAAALAAADALRPKREWEGAFAEESSAGQVMNDMVEEVCPMPTAAAAATAAAAPAAKRQTCFKSLLVKIRAIFCCCASSRHRPQTIVINESTPVPSTVSKKPTIAASSLTANALIYGSWDGASATYEKPKDVLLRSDPVKGEFISHAGPTLGSYDDICGDEDEAEFYRPSDAPSTSEPASNTPPLHRQTNFTSQDEVAAAAAPPEPTQVEKDMDEVFALLRGPVTTVNVEPLAAAAAVPAAATDATIQEPSEQSE